MMMQYIQTIRDGDRVSGIYLCKSKQSLKTKNGKTYYSLQLQDYSGTVDAKVWDLGPGIEHFEAMDFIKVEGNATTYQGSLQLTLRRIRVADEGEYDVADYIPTSRFSIKSMYQSLLELINSVQEPHLLELLRHFFVEDAGFIKSFKAHSAAKSIHHGYAGGLLEHTLSVAKMCDYYAEYYDFLNRDLLITAAICHDIGKTKELSVFPANDYTDDGQLIGHIVLGAQMVDEQARRIQGFPEDLRRQLVHCILAHHGELEYGSPKKPALVEAVALNMADNTDARLEILREFLDDGKDKKWAGYNRLFESNIMRTVRTDARSSTDRDDEV